MESSSQGKWLEVAFVQEGGRDLCYQNLAPTEVLLSHSQKFNKFFRRTHACFYPGSTTSLQGHGNNACNGTTP